MPDILGGVIWTLIITAGVLSALILFDGCIELGMRIERWRDR